MMNEKNEWMDERTKEWMNGWMDGWMDGCPNEWMNEIINEGHEENEMVMGKISQEPSKSLWTRLISLKRKEI